MTDIINGKPASAYRYAFTMIQDHDGQISIAPVEGGKLPESLDAVALLHAASCFFQDKLLIDTFHGLTDAIFRRGQSDKERFLELLGQKREEEWADRVRILEGTLKHEQELNRKLEDKLHKREREFLDPDLASK